MTVMMLVSLSTLVSAQSVAVVGSKHRINPNGEAWQESSVAARQTVHDELVVAAERVDGGVGYGVSLDGGLSFSNGVLSWTGAADTGVAVDPLTDRLWITALVQSGQFKTIRGAWKEPLATQYNGANQYVLVGPYDATSLDRPTLRILSNVQHTERHLLTFDYNHDNLAPDAAVCPLGAWGAFSDNPYVPPFSAWDMRRMRPDFEPHGCRWQGWGATPVELSDGRVVVVVHDYPDHGVWQYNGGLPYVVYSDDGGQTWLPNDVLPVRVATNGLIIPAKYDEGTPSWSDTPKNLDHFSCAPAIAADPSTSPNDVYVAFYARANRNDNTASDRNTDIYISRSRDQGETFPGNPGNPNLLQLTDEMLGLTPDEFGFGPDQVMPSIAVDPCGGVDVVFYDNRFDDNRNDNVHLYDVYFARVKGYGDTNTIQQARLTPSSFTLPTGPQDFLGDYHHMALTTPQPLLYTLYPAWIAMDNGIQNCYVNKISILCVGGLSSYLSNEQDACGLFEQLQKEGTIDGDLNGDEVVDSEDEAIFAKLIEGLKD